MHDDIDARDAGVHPVFEHACTQRLTRLREELAALTGDPERSDPMSDVHRIDQLRLLEQIKASAAAAQARITVTFDRSQLARQDAAGVRRDQRGRGISDQVALARGCPASQGARHLGFAKAMAEMPHAFALLGGGHLDEWTATLLVRESAILSLEDRTRVDERLCAMTVHADTGEVSDPLVLGWTPTRVARAARALAAELDPESAARRSAKAAADRRVSIWPSPDTMHPRCDSDIGDRDHVVRVADGGGTIRANGQGLCEAHNLVKEMPGWGSRVLDHQPGRHAVEVRTPTGHTYRSNAPPALPPTV